VRTVGAAARPGWLDAAEVAAANHRSTWISTPLPEQGGRPSQVCKSYADDRALTVRPGPQRSGKARSPGRQPPNSSVKQGWTIRCPASPCPLQGFSTASMDCRDHRLSPESSSLARIIHDGWPKSPKCLKHIKLQVRCPFVHGNRNELHLGGGRLRSRAFEFPAHNPG